MWAWLGDALVALGAAAPILLCGACIGAPTVIAPAQISQPRPPTPRPPYFGSANIDHETWSRRADHEATALIGHRP